MLQTEPKFKHDRQLFQCHSWDDFVSLAEARSTTKEKGDLLERLTQLFLLSQPEYSSKLDAVWTLPEVPSNVRKLLDLPNLDEGIDLVAETKEGEYWAIQCKYRSDHDKALTSTELSKFSNLAFVHCKNIDLGLIAHTSKKPILKLKLLGNVTELGLATWLELTGDDWKAIHSLIRGKAPKLAKRKPRRHQKAAILDAKKHFLEENNSRGLMIMPCGSGKSLAAYWIARELEAKNIIVAVPSLSLIKQSLKDWTREFLAEGIVPKWLCVCSDESVGNVDKDELVSDTYELGIPTTTDESEIRQFLEAKSPGYRIVFTTYQSGAKLAAGAVVTCSPECTHS